MHSLHHAKPPFKHVRISEKNDFLSGKNAAIATAQLIIHAAGEEAMGEMLKIYQQNGFAEMVFPGKVFLEICSTKKGIRDILQAMHLG